MYGAPLGRPADAEPARREVWIQRHLVGRAQWVGLVVHGAAEWYLRALMEGRRVDPAGIVDRATGEARRAVAHSEASLYRGDPAGFTGFDAHYYGQPFDGAEAVEEVRDKVSRLLEHPVVQRLSQVPERIREVEQVSRLRLAGVEVFVSPDVIVDDGAGGVVVIDWKTGRQHHPDDVDGQLGVYGLYALRAYAGVDPERGDLPLARVRGLYAHVDGDHRTVPLSVGDIDAALDAIRSSTPEMRGDDVSAASEAPPLAAFPMVAEGDPRCGWCSFRRTCGRE